MSSFLESTYGLKESPFKQRSALWEQLPTWVNREDQMAQWEKILDDSIQTPSANFIALIVGDYGLGKSLSLFKIIEEAEKRKVHYSIYMSLLSEQRPRKPGLDIVLRIFRNVDFNKISIKPNKLKKLDELDQEITIIFNHILFGDNKIKELALAYLRGQISTTQTQLKKLGILKKIDETDLALDYLIGLLYILKESGYQNFLITIDEFEYVFSLVSKSTQPIYLALFRRLYDLRVRIPKKLRKICTNITIFLAVSPDGERNLENLQISESSTGGPTAALRRRISYNKIYLTALLPKYTRELVEKRLKLNRITGKFEDEPLIPFTEEFVEFIHKISDGRPETIIDRCDNVLDQGLENRVNLLTEEFAKKVFMDRGIDVSTYVEQ